MEKIKISVIIPVYNAADFVKQAVESALSQPETAEVVLVEDGSPDESLAACEELAAIYPKVHLYRHLNGKNLGAGATRNLAISKSTQDYLAFLDADDFFLPNRFTTARELFGTNPDLDGVYEAVGMYIQDDRGAERWDRAGRSRNQLVTLQKKVPPEELFETLIQGRFGYLLLDGLVIKRAAIGKSGWFDERLPLHQDTLFIEKLAAVARLLPGRLDEPVSMWRIHDHNRISAPRSHWQIYDMRMRLWYSLWCWCRETQDEARQQIVLKYFIARAMYLSRFNRLFPKGMYGLQKRLQLLMLPLDYPVVLREKVFWKAFVPDLGFWIKHH